MNEDTKNFSMELNFSERIPEKDGMVIDIRIINLMNMKMLGTEHLNLTVKNKNDYPIKLTQIGIEIPSMSLIYEQDIKIVENNSYSIQIAYEIFKEELKRYHIERPCKVRGYAKLDTNEIFFSKEVEFR